jgi:serine phosphatase RsbU (regulator of sigma subunit)
MATRLPSVAAAVVRLLLVEDDEGDAFIVRELLDESPAAIDVVWVRTLAEAQAALPDGFDCVLIDLGLPDAHGLEALRGVLTEVEDTAVLVLTGLDDEHRGTEAVAAGAQDYLLKGQVDARALMRSIRYAVERKRTEEQLRRLYASELQAAENARLERGLLPQPRTTDPAIRVINRYRSGRGGLLGGDFFDVVETTDGIVHLLIGDVCGHGPDEAALGVCLRVAWRTLVLAGVRGAELVSVLEDVLIAERRNEEVFATVCMVTVSAQRDEAELLLAGHPAPLLLGPEPQQLPDDVICPALGMLEGVAWTSRPISLPAGWRLMLFTDGLIEVRAGVDGNDQLGVEGLLRLIRASGETIDPGTAGELADYLLAQARALHGEELSDDVAIVVVEHGTSGR